LEEGPLLRVATPLFQGTIQVIGQLNQKWFHGQVWAIPLLFIYQLTGKSLEFILSVVFAFGIYCCEPTSCVQRSSPCKSYMPSLGFKNKIV